MTINLDQVGVTWIVRQVTARVRDALFLFHHLSDEDSYMSPSEIICTEIKAEANLCLRRFMLAGMVCNELIPSNRWPTDHINN